MAIEIIQGAEPVRVEIDGVVVAESTRPVFLDEAGLRRRTYLPREDVRMDLLEHTAKSSVCPYKGTAEYWSARVGGAVHEDVAWSYADPIPEAAAIAGLIAFYDERVKVLVG